MKNDPRAGFTLIELMVVIGILGLLIAVLTPRLLESQRSAEIFADQAQLKNFHYPNLFEAKKRYKLPDGGGHKFVLWPWVNRVCDRTEANRDKFFLPNKTKDDPRWAELSEQDPKQIWNSFDELRSDDTHYAGRAKSEFRNMWSGEEPLIADDNEYGNSFDDGTINVLLANGSVKELTRAEDLAQWWDEGDEGFVFPVGPQSQHPLLKKLEK
jgi:prepilin-type N-terminal cleavage/methylation domain-containing protein